MSEYDRKLQAAQAEMAQAGVRPKDLNPLLLRGLRKIGLTPRHPYYAAFTTNALIMGGYFGICWGALMWLFFWRSQDMPASMVIILALLAGTFFGLIMAWFYARKHKQLRLSDWRAL